MPVRWGTRNRTGAKRQHRGVLGQKRAAKKRKVSASSAAKPRRTTAPHLPQSQDFEEILINSLLHRGGAASDTTPGNILFGSTDAARRLGYKFGFYVGKGIHAQGGGIDSLFLALENLGFGKVLYYPSGRNVVITSGMSALPRAPLGNRMHILESGIMAGYLSGHTGTLVDVFESSCAHEGNGRCQFIASPSDSSRPIHRGRNVRGPVGEIARNVLSQSSHEDAEGEQMHLMLQYLPLSKDPVVGAVSRILSKAGAMLAGECHGDHAAAINGIRRCFDLASVETINRSSKRVIRLKYKQYNSMEGLVNLSGSMALGFARAFYRSKPEIRTGLNKDGTYFLDIKMKK